MRSRIQYSGSHETLGSLIKDFTRVKYRTHTVSAGAAYYPVIYDLSFSGTTNFQPLADITRN